ncbi:hypothetical protein N9740_04540 [Pseudomonadales bacterium]|nr:hypothetical protein [Pseudomonadales bacterium]MDB9868260.1 hypothetical protein [Pseudomonadales bacterium]MDB9942379.1 hypothetical protein [Pseudomonadales bacterium]MDC0174394.1 hypothetical protein [Pseudomonadales bacterium]MDC1306767.1 hypothetical protein [Pseudomonadales bacterium]|tara:strand:- start:134 stop:667 length:534 start_codon:yes stop_codon:yes gene_type:complete
MSVLKKAGVISLWLLLILATAIITAATKQRFADGPNRVFSGGALVAGELYRGVEPDWSFVNDVDTLELQLLNPEQSRRIWTASVDGKIYVWSGYMNSLVGKLWKSWPAQAEKDGRAIVRINGVRYERQLVRIKSGAGLEALTELLNEKYASSATPAAIDSGDLWMFEAAPRTTGEAQ